VTFPPEIGCTLTPPDSKCEMSSEYASSVPMLRQLMWRTVVREGRIHESRMSLEKATDGFTILFQEIQAESMDAI
jgi:hypothetical protein